MNPILQLQPAPPPPVCDDIAPLLLAMVDTDPAALATYCEAVRQTLRHIERTRQYHYFADSGAMAALTAIQYARLKDQ